MERQLVVIAGPDAGRTFPLHDGQTLVVGRGQASDTQLADAAMSRVHCRVIVDGNRVILMDAESKTGTLVGGQRITEHELKPGDIFTVGDSQLRLESHRAQETATIIRDPSPSVVAASANTLEKLLGQTFASFRLDAILAQGSSSMVFRATDVEHNRAAAVKVLSPDRARSDEQKDRFVRAMKTMMPISHPNIVRILNAGKTGPYCWAAMEFVDGESMTQVIDRIGIEGMLDWRDVWRVAVHVGRALEEAWNRKIVHRNVTPNNILRRKADKVCLLGDLFLAKALEGTLAQQVTQQGQVVGEVPYLAPERILDSAKSDNRSDMYSLGATLYALLTGRPPFESKSVLELMRQIRVVEPVKPKKYQLAVNDQFQEIVLKLLSKRPEDRFETPVDLLKDLNRVGKYQNVSADP